MEKKKKIVLVDYFNTEPFLAGLRTAVDQYEIIGKIPAECTTCFNSKKADIGLVPVASFFEMELAHMITNYGIGCDGTVRTVVLFSNTHKTEIRKIYLDDHSRTSVQLCRIVAKRFWNIDVEFVRTDVSRISLGQNEAMLMIGDKVFVNEGRYDYAYDLGEEWKEETGLPFVFAIWVSHEKVSEVEEQGLNAIFEKGLQQIPKIVKDLKKLKDMDLQSYFEKNIVYRIGEEGREAIALFKSLLISSN